MWLETICGQRQYQDERSSLWARSRVDIGSGPMLQHNVIVHDSTLGIRASCCHERQKAIPVTIRFEMTNIRINSSPSLGSFGRKSC
jgi:hypothetical protein